MNSQLENAVLVRDDVDRKILILFVLNQLPAPIDSELLYDVCFCDDGLGYFDYSVCLEDLVRSANVNELDDEYSITEKGRRNAETLLTSLPYSVRNAAKKRIAPVAEMLSRYQLITTEYEERESGTVIHLGLSDGEVRLLDMKLFCGDETTARKIKKNFRREAEIYYNTFLHSLTAGTGKDKT